MNWYNAQYYNGWGDASTAVNYNDIIELGGWSADRVVMSVLDSPNTDTSTIKQQLKELHTFAHGEDLRWVFGRAQRTLKWLAAIRGLPSHTLEVWEIALEEKLAAGDS